jgi:hypothetical protein
MRDWLDNRTGFRSLLKHMLDEPLPSGVGWWFVTGSIVLFLLSVQLLTGVLLAVFYSPSPDHAYDSASPSDACCAASTSSAPASSSLPRSSICCASWHSGPTRSRAS